MQVVDIRKNNEIRVLQVVRDRVQVSQAEIALETGLQASTVYRMVKTLQHEGWIESCPTPPDLPDRLGRPPAYYQVRARSTYIVGVDFWSAYFAVVVTDFAGTVLIKQTYDFEDGINAEIALARIEGAIEKLARELNISFSEVLGIGVGAPGVVDIREGMVILYARMPGMDHFDIRRRLEKRFNVRVQVHNTVSIAAWGVHHYAQKISGQSSVAVLIRSGVGGAYLSDGEIFVSRNKTALEIGHLTIDLKKSVQNCGNGSCVEQFISEDAFLQRAVAACGVMTIADLVARLEAGDQDVIQAIEPSVVVLTQLVRNVAHILDPEEFVIVSRFLPFSEFLTREILRRLEGMAASARIHILRVVPYEYDPIMSCRSAAELLVRAFLKGDTLLKR